MQDTEPKGGLTHSLETRRVSNYIFNCPEGVGWVLSLHLRPGHKGEVTGFAHQLKRPTNLPTMELPRLVLRNPGYHRLEAGEKEEGYFLEGFLLTLVCGGGIENIFLPEQVRVSMVRLRQAVPSTTPESDETPGKEEFQQEVVHLQNTIELGAAAVYD